MSDSLEKQFVREFLFEHTGLVLRELDTSSEKTPDFATDTIAGVMVAELKTLQLTDPSSDAGWELVPDDPGGLCRRTDNGAARIARCIKSAYKQLKPYPHPRALILLNDSALDFFDLKSVFTGRVEYEGGIVDVSARKVALGDTRELRDDIDLYIWIDRRSEQPTHRGYWTSRLGARIAAEHLRGKLGGA